MAKAKESIDWRTRIVNYGRQAADQFLAHPSNPKYHPPEQREALRGSINEVGQIAPVMVSHRSKYTLDGHDRIWLALETNADVDFFEVDVTEAEELYILATFDPIGMMARHDAEKLDALLREVNTGEAGVQAMLAALAQDMGIMPPDFQPVDIGEQPRLDQKKPIICPHCGHEFIHHG